MQITDVIRQMADNDLRLVCYHATRIGKGNRELIELQATSAWALNASSSGFKGPIPVHRELLDDLLQLMFIEQIATPRNSSQSVFQLTEAGRARARALHGE